MVLIHLLLLVFLGIGRLSGSDLGWVIDLDEEKNQDYLDHGQWSPSLNMSNCIHTANSSKTKD